MKIIFFGTPSFVVPILENLTKHFDVIAVVTAPDRKSGRKQLLTPSPVKVFAEQHNIQVLQPENNEEMISQLSSLNAQLNVVAAYGKIMPDTVVSAPEYGSINIHPSLLPKYRGASPIQTTILNGDTQSGITYIKMDDKMDHGPILQTIPYEITPTDTTDFLLQAMFKQSAIILPSIIERYVSGEIKPEAQDDAQASYCKQFSKQDGYIDLLNPPDAKTCERMIRAFYPWPTAWTTVRIPGKDQATSKILKFLPERKVQIEGKQPVTLDEFKRGYPTIAEHIATLFK